MVKNPPAMQDPRVQSLSQEHRYTFVPHPEPSSLLPPHTIPLGRPSAPAPSIQYRASNLDWRLVPYMILYVFQCHSPKSSHPLPFPQSPKDCSTIQLIFEKSTNRLSTVNGRKTVGNTLAVECSSSVRKNKQLINRATWMNLHGTTLSEEKAHPRGYVLYDSTFKTFLKREQIGIVRV